jgi:hypothetical protein
MSKWDWLTKPQTPYTRGFIFRVLIKATMLFVLINVVFALLNPLPLLGQLSVYNWLAAGRSRLPYGENAAQSYNLSLTNLNAMFASHEVARPKAADEYRVLLVGDSATWGVLLRPEETIAGVLNAENLVTADGRQMRFYNIAHPVLALSKDLMLLDYAMRYKPDMVIWLFTAQSFPVEQQVYPPLVQQNAETMRRLITDYDLNIDLHDARFVTPTFLDNTLVGRRRDLADMFRLQLYGFAWTSTGIDQYYPPSYTSRATDLENDLAWYSFTEPRELTHDDLSFDVLSAGIERAGNIPVLLVNEPIFISDGLNSDVRYNAWYPRWAYDSYRALLTQTADAQGWTLFDAWESIAGVEFTDSPVHLTPTGVQQFVALLVPEIMTEVDHP